MELVMKEVLSIRMTPEQTWNWNVGNIFLRTVVYKENLHHFINTDQLTRQCLVWRSWPSQEEVKSLYHARTGQTESDCPHKNANVVTVDKINYDIGSADVHMQDCRLIAWFPSVRAHGNPLVLCALCAVDTMLHWSDQYHSYCMRVVQGLDQILLFPRGSATPD